MAIPGLSNICPGALSKKAVDLAFHAVPERDSGLHFSGHAVDEDGHELPGCGRSSRSSDLILRIPSPVHSAHIADVSYKRLTRAVDLTGAVAITFVL
jgi:hypothetical protein